MRAYPRSVLIGVALLLGGCAQATREEHPPRPEVGQERVWVEIWGKTSDNKDYYNYGWIYRWEYDRIVFGGKLPEVLRVNDVHWYSDDGVVLLEDDVKTGVNLMRTDRIMRISLIRPEDMDKLRRDEKEARAKKEQKKEAAPLP